MMKTKKCCDNCERYRWYYDYCKKWKCEVDDRGVCSSWTERVKPKDTDIAREQEQKIGGKNMKTKTVHGDTAMGCFLASEILLLDAVR